ncbi:unnamed protein product [Pleuronectes platessa]|uniref:Uncharacterized protein n=1 Tax=Pleuronectes platessa TaxID=8262 RepID=A0A9N7UDJ8_PLEPL|nr:unnamed protein product [Pleuronectes platessa]
MVCASEALTVSYETLLRALATLEVCSGSQGRQANRQAHRVPSAPAEREKPQRRCHRVLHTGHREEEEEHFLPPVLPCPSNARLLHLGGRLTRVRERMNTCSLFLSHSLAPLPHPGPPGNLCTHF